LKIVLASQIVAKRCCGLGFGMHILKEIIQIWPFVPVWPEIEAPLADQLLQMVYVLTLLTTLTSGNLCV